MSGFDFRPKIKDVDYYIDAITDVVDQKVGVAIKAPLLDYLLNEELAAENNGEREAANLFKHIRTHLALDPTVP